MVITDYEDRHRRRHPQPRPPKMKAAAVAELEEEEEERVDYMAASLKRSKGSLPNFSSLPCFNVKWGRRVHLRCVKDGVDHGDADDDFLQTSSLCRRESLTRSELNSERKRRSSDDGGIEAMREKLMLDFRAEVSQMQAALLKKSNVIPPPSVSPPAAAEPRPWNLRTRRAVCKEPNNLPLSGDRKLNLSPAKQSEVKSPARRNSGELNGGDGSERPRAKFSGSLSKQEIEEDFLAMVGTRPARRPKKRPKYVQKQIDAVFPGFWLSEITPDMYKVNEQP